MPKKSVKLVRATGTRILNEYIEELPVPLTQEEIVARATSLTRLEDEERKSSGVFEHAKALHKAEVERIAEERRKLLQAIREKREPRPVKVEGWAHYDVARYREIRSDTGELVNERALLPSEYQESLDLGPEPTQPGA
jgi:hypothetical protein